MTLGERVAEMKDQTPPEIRQAGAADFPRREAASFNKIGADNRAPRLQFQRFRFSIVLVAGDAALTGSVSDLRRSATLAI
jgi:hypothetical protein